MQTIDSVHSPETHPNRYPDLVTRVKAVFVDTVILIILMFVFTSIFENMKEVPQWARVVSFIFIFVAYDPLFTSLAGGTLGHLAMGLRVRDNTSETKRIIFPMAVIRYAIKLLLGWVSFLTISSNPKGRALHDMVAMSVVVIHTKTS